MKCWLEPKISKLNSYRDNLKRMIYFKLVKNDLEKLDDVRTCRVNYRVNTRRE